MKAPILPLELPVQQNTELTLTEGGELGASRLESCTLAGTVTGFKLDGVVAHKSDLTAMRVKRLEVADLRLEECLLFGAHWDGASWHRVEVMKSMGSGLILSDALLRDVRFEGCKLDVANFRMAKFQNVSFVDCYLKEADFQGASLRGAVFDRCELEQAEFSGADLVGADLRTSKLFGLRGSGSLKGAIVSRAQLFDLAPALARDVGLKVVD